MDCVAPPSRCGSPLLLLTCALLMTSSHSEGWLFHIINDPGEHTDVSAAYPLVHAKLLARALELDLTQIDGLKGDGWRGLADPAAACAAAVRNNGTWGPHMP